MHAFEMGMLSRARKRQKDDRERKIANLHLTAAMHGTVRFKSRISGRNAHGEGTDAAHEA
jgi:hypothetical protein